MAFLVIAIYFLLNLKFPIFFSSSWLWIEGSQSRFIVVVFTFHISNNSNILHIVEWFANSGIILSPSYLSIRQKTHQYHFIGKWYYYYIIPICANEGVSHGMLKMVQWCECLICNTVDLVDNSHATVARARRNWCESHWLRYIWSLQNLQKILQTYVCVCVCVLMYWCVPFPLQRLDSTHSYRAYIFAASPALCFESTGGIACRYITYICICWTLLVSSTSATQWAAPYRDRYVFNMVFFALSLSLFSSICYSPPVIRCIFFCSYFAPMCDPFDGDDDDRPTKHHTTTTY